MKIQDNPNRSKERDPNIPSIREADGSFGEKFGNDYGYGREGEMGERDGENARNQDDGNEYVDRYSPAEYTAVNADPGPEHLSNEELMDEIYRRLSRHPGIDLTTLDIQINGGQVTFAGAVGNPDTRQVIEQEASDVEGVHEVVFQEGKNG